MGWNFYSLRGIDQKRVSHELEELTDAAGMPHEI